MVLVICIWVIGHAWLKHWNKKCKNTRAICLGLNSKPEDFKNFFVEGLFLFLIFGLTWSLKHYSMSTLGEGIKCKVRQDARFIYIITFGWKGLNWSYFSKQIYLTSCNLNTKIYYQFVLFSYRYLASVTVMIISNTRHLCFMNMCWIEINFAYKCRENLVSCQNNKSSS